MFPEVHLWPFCWEEVRVKKSKRILRSDINSITFALPKWKTGLKSEGFQRLGWETTFICHLADRTFIEWMIIDSGPALILLRNECKGDWFSREKNFRKGVQVSDNYCSWIGLVMRKCCSPKDVYFPGLTSLQEFGDFGEYEKLLQWRVWSWLRMNASGRPNTCKSNGKYGSNIIREWRTGA